ncbi:hypothetical protein [Rudaeicoccus suwonensis]|uniref:Acid stress chaperone HdeA n=1 Tax=Rudaeicoccus suwonensis TaxID=657409 RepID=A0A561E8U9_9MICO|nr:hypothetical protein [Rudaeicoccus suwonensis]TWE12044.1 hypothetical protein BKA23_0840 [Rudaeicoccus suwonensis]
MKTFSRIAVTAVLVAAPFSLAACGSGASKPAKADVISGYASAMQNQKVDGKSAISGELSNKVATCVVDKVYGQVDASTLNAMKSGTPTKVSSSDQSNVQSAITSCTNSLMSSMGG